MKTKVLSFIIALSLVIASCGSNKQAEIDKLKKQQQSISDKIKNL
jgi:hypothetical protein